MQFVSPWVAYLSASGNLKPTGRLGCGGGVISCRSASKISRSDIRHAPLLRLQIAISKPGRASAEAGLVEHRDERRPATMVFAKIRDTGREPLALAGRVGGAAGVLEHRDGPGVGPAAGLEQ